MLFACACTRVRVCDHVCVRCVTSTYQRLSRLGLGRSLLFGDLGKRIGHGPDDVHGERARALPRHLRDDVTSCSHRARASLLHLSYPRQLRLPSPLAHSILPHCARLCPTTPNPTLSFPVCPPLPALPTTLHCPTHSTQPHPTSCTPPHSRPPIPTPPHPGPPHPTPPCPTPPLPAPPRPHHLVEVDGDGVASCLLAALLLLPYRRPAPPHPSPTPPRPSPPAPSC